MNRVKFIVVCLMLALLTDDGRQARGQNTPVPSDAALAQGADESRGEAANDSTVESSEIPLPPRMPAVESDFIYLPGPDGKLIKVLVKSDLLKYLDWLKTRDRKVVDEQPVYGISSLQMTGMVENDQLLMSIRIELQVTVDRKWIRVPLSLNEAVIRDVKYHGAGNEALPVRVDNQADARRRGYAWWFRGKGEHVLEIDAVVPLFVQSPTRRLRLSLPQTAVGSLMLTVPYSKIQARLPEESTSLLTVRQDKSDTSRSQIELVGLDQQLDVSWQPTPETQPIELVLQSAAEMELDFTGDSVLLHVRQQVRSLQGTFDKIEVHLPKDFELLDLEADKYLGHEAMKDRADVITVRLSEATTGPIELNWTLKAPFPARGVPLTIEGFEVEQARRQTGDILLRAVDGYRIQRREGNDQYIHHINVDDGELSDKISSAYRFLKQPFRLELDVQQEEPFYLVTPELLAHVSDDRIELQGRFRYQVLRGAVSHVVIRWPKAVAEAWSIDPVQKLGLIESVTTSEEGEVSIWNIKFVERKAGSFEIALNARKKIVSDGGNLTWYLPRADAPSQAPTLLTWILDEDVESELHPASNTTLRAVPSVLSSKIEIPVEWSGLRRMHWRIDSSEQILDFAVKKFPRLVETNTTVEPRIGEKLISVSQRLTYEVSYERISSVRVTVPSDLSPRPRFFMEDGQPLVPIWTEDQESRMLSGRLDLPEPRLKRFEIQARYLVPVNSSDQSDAHPTVKLPIIQSADATFKFTQLLLSQPSEWEVDVDDKNWQGEVADEGTLAFRASGARTQVPLTMRRRQGDRARSMTIPRSIARIRCEADGTTLLRVQYVIETADREFTLKIPPRMELINAWSNQESIDFLRTEIGDTDAIEYRFPLRDDTRSTSAEAVPAAITASSTSTGTSGDVGVASGISIPATAATQDEAVVLTVELRSRQRSGFDWVEGRDLELPVVPPHVLIEQSIVEIVIPGEQHLATYPSGLSPLFQWTLTSKGWQRLSRGGWNDPENWLDPTQDAPPLPDGFLRGNSYVFSRFAAVDSLSFHAIHRSLLVLLGAGVSLIGCAIWLNVPMARHPYSIVILAMLGSLAALLHEPTVLLLIQPMLGGLLLAILAFFIDRRFRSDGRPTVVTLGSTNEFMLPVSSIVTSGSMKREESTPESNREESGQAPSRSAPSIGSEDPTTMRPSSPSGHRDSVSIIDLGSRT